MKKIIFTIFLLFSVNIAFACKGTDSEWSKTINSVKHTVKGPYTIDQLEQAKLIEIRETKEKLPFGYINNEWNSLKSKYTKGDRLFFVKYEDGLFFMEQHVLVRGGCVIGFIRGSIS